MRFVMHRKARALWPPLDSEEQVRDVVHGWCDALGIERATTRLLSREGMVVLAKERGLQSNRPISGLAWMNTDRALGVAFARERLNLPQPRWWQRWGSRSWEEAYRLHMVLHEVAHLVDFTTQDAEDYGHGPDFKRIERRLNATYGIRLVYLRGSFARLLLNRWYVPFPIANPQLAKCLGAGWRDRVDR
jgi:hypothetical protein